MTPKTDDEPPMAQPSRERSLLTQHDDAKAPTAEPRSTTTSAVGTRPLSAITLHDGGHEEPPRTWVPRRDAPKSPLSNTIVSMASAALPPRGEGPATAAFGSEPVTRVEFPLPEVLRSVEARRGEEAPLSSSLPMASLINRQAEARSDRGSGWSRQQVRGDLCVTREMSLSELMPEAELPTFGSAAQSSRGPAPDSSRALAGEPHGMGSIMASAVALEVSHDVASSTGPVPSVAPRSAGAAGRRSAVLVAACAVAVIVTGGSILLKAHPRLLASAKHALAAQVQPAVDRERRRAPPPPSPLRGLVPDTLRNTSADISRDLPSKKPVAESMSAVAVVGGERVVEQVGHAPHSARSTAAIESAPPTERAAPAVRGAPPMPGSAELERKEPMRGSAALEREGPMPGSAALEREEPMPGSAALEREEPMPGSAALEREQPNRPSTRDDAAGQPASPAVSEHGPLAAHGPSERTAAAHPTAGADEEALFASPRMAANLYIAGRYKEALAEYRMLATLKPEVPAYAQFARVLRKRLVETCVRTQPRRQAECEQL